MLSNRQKSNLACSRGGTWEPWQLKEEEVHIYRCSSKEIILTFSRLYNPCPKLRERKDTKRSSFHIQKHGWSRTNPEMPECRMVRLEGHYQDQGEFLTLSPLSALISCSLFVKLMLILEDAGKR